MKQKIRSNFITVLCFLLLVACAIVPVSAAEVTVETHKHHLADSSSGYELCVDCGEQVWTCATCTNLNGIELTQCPLCLENRGAVTPEEKAAEHLARKENGIKNEKTACLISAIMFGVVSIAFVVSGVVHWIKAKKMSGDTSDCLIPFTLSIVFLIFAGLAVLWCFLIGR